MSSHIADENSEGYNNLTCSLIPIRSCLDFGYLPFASPCLTSSPYLSPLRVTSHQPDSPVSEYDLQSPIYVARRKPLSTAYYETYISTRKYFDIITELSYRDAFHILDEILVNLSTNDLSRCANVCREWYSIFQDNYRRRQAQKVKRNLFTVEKKTSTRKIKLTSTPFQAITNLPDTQSSIPLIVKTNTDENTLPSSEQQKLPPPTPAQTENTFHLAASTMTFRYGYLKHLHGPTVPKRCPICAYVSIVDVNDQHGVCTNPFCRNSFCQWCSGPYHPSSPCKTSTGPIRSPWRQRATLSPIFSHKTRVNLRRLLV